MVNVVECLVSRVPSIYGVVVRVVAHCSIYTASTQHLHCIYTISPYVGMAAPGMVLVPLLINTLHTRTNLLRNYPRAVAPLQVQLHLVDILCIVE